MNLLVIDTTGPACSVALRVPGRADLLCSEIMARGQAERLAPMVAEVLAQAGLVPRDLDRIGVTTGPGSFAGTRVGVAFARGLALATGAETVGLSNLEWWAVEAGLADGEPVLVVHDAKRGEVVTQVCQRECARPAALTQSIADALSWLEDRQDTTGSQVKLTGSGAHLLDNGPERASPGLTALVDLAATSQSPFDPPKPFYARPPDAKLPGGHRPEL